MSGIASKLAHNRERSHGIGTNSQAVKYLNQDYEALRDSCLERGRLFEDDCFEALPSSLGFKELGPSSYKVRGITWKRPGVGRGAAAHTMCFRKCIDLKLCKRTLWALVCMEGSHATTYRLFVSLLC